MQISCNINQLPSCKCHPSAHGSSQRPAAPIHHCPSEGGSCLAERKKMVIQNMLEKMVVSYCNQVVASTSEMIVIGDHHLGSSSQSHFCIWLRITNMYMYIYIYIYILYSIISSIIWSLGVIVLGWKGQKCLEIESKFGSWITYHIQCNMHVSMSCSLRVHP